MNLRQTRALLTKVPFNTLLGMRIRGVHRDGVTIDCTLRDDLRNSVGVAHGGVSAAMADAAVGIALQPFRWQASDRHRRVKNQLLPTRERRPHPGSVSPSSYWLYSVCRQRGAHR